MIFFGKVLDRMLFYEKKYSLEDLLYKTITTSSTLYFVSLVCIPCIFFVKGTFFSYQFSISAFHFHISLWCQFSLIRLMYFNATSDDYSVCMTLFLSSRGFQVVEFSHYCCMLWFWEREKEKYCMVYYLSEL